MKIRRILTPILAFLGVSVPIAAQGMLSASPPPVNSAAFVQGLPRGGALATAFVFGLTGKPGLLTAPSSSFLPFELGGVQVSVNGAPAPILAVVIPETGSSSPGMINFQVPMERNASFDVYNLGAAPHLTVSQYPLGQVELPVTGGNGFGGFFSDGKGFVIAQHTSDLSLVTTQNPARPGETILVYADDFFEVWPPPPIGIPTPSQPVFQADTTGRIPGIRQFLYLQAYPDFTIPKFTCASGPTLKVLFAGLAPGFVGVEQIKIVIPTDQEPGDWSLFFSAPCPVLFGGFASPKVLLPVR